MANLTTSQPGVYRFIGIDWNIGALKTAGPRYWKWIAFLAVFAAMGAVGWTQLIAQGGEVLAFRDSNAWGLWFVNYMYYVGLSAGGLVVYASVHLFGAVQYRPLSRFAVLQAGTLCLMALLSILTDMERPWRMIWFMLTPNPSAPFVYTGSAAAIYTIICFVDLWVMITGKGGHKLAHNMTLIALPFAIYLHTTTAFVLALNKSRELWHTAMMVPIFLTSATASGIALLFIFAYIVQATTQYKFPSSMFRSLATLLATVMIIDIFLLLVEILVIFWGTSSKPGHAIRMTEFFSGAYMWSFLPVLIFGITAFALLSRRPTRHLPAVQLTAAALYVVGVYLKRYSLMGMGFVYDTLGKFNGVYLPSLTEVLVALLIVAIGLLILSFGVKVLPMEETGHDEHDEHDEAPAEPAFAPAVAVTEGGVAQ